jgi:hypothetical protein
VSSRADRRRRDRRTTAPAPTKPSGPAAEPSAAPLRPSIFDLPGGVLAERALFGVVAAIVLVMLARALDARITWYLAVDQFGYLQFAHDLLQGKIFHDWEPARLLGQALPGKTDILSQTYLWDHGRMYCRYAPGFPMLAAAWIGLFGDARVSFLNPTLYLWLMVVVIACAWRLSRSLWRGLVVVVIVALTPTQMYWWSLTLTRDLSSHVFGLMGLYVLLPVEGRPLSSRRAFLALLPIGFAASIRNDAIIYMVPAMGLAVLRWWRERPDRARTLRLGAVAVAGLVLGLLPTLAYNTAVNGNPLKPTQGMEVQSFIPSTPAPLLRDSKIGYPSGMWKGGSLLQVQGGGLQLKNFWTTWPTEWFFIYQGYGAVLIGLAVLGALVALVTRPALFVMTVPYILTAFFLYSCWSKADRRYIIGIYTLLPFLVAEGVCGTVELLQSLVKRDEGPVRMAGIVIALVALGVAVGPIPLPPVFPQDAGYLSGGVIPILAWLLPGALALGAAAVALWPHLPVVDALAPVLALVLAGLAFQRADVTRMKRAPFQGPEARVARETLRRTLDPKSIVITSEDMGRPAENIEHYGGVPALYVTDLTRWRLSISRVSLSFINAGVRPYLLVDRGVPERDGLLTDLAKNGYRADKILDIPPEKNMQYFVAAPIRREVGGSELYRISKPDWEELMRSALPKGG